MTCIRTPGGLQGWVVRVYFSSSWRPRKLRASKMLARRPLGACFRALGGPRGSETPKCSPESFLEHVFELLAAQRLQNPLQEASWSLFSSSWRPRRLRASKMLARMPPGACLRALGSPGGSEAPQCSPESLLEPVFELFAAQEAQRLQTVPRRPPGDCFFRRFCAPRGGWQLARTRRLVVSIGACLIRGYFGSIIKQLTETGFACSRVYPKHR